MAFSKVCPYCKEQSFSAGTDTHWICPSCGKDLSDIPIDDYDKYFSTEKDKDKNKGSSNDVIKP